MVTVSSGLIETMKKDEIKSVLAHECGHIACEHVLYHTMANLMLRFGESIFGLQSKAALPLTTALMYWYRRSEYSADRASAFAMEGYMPTVRSFMRLSGATTSIAEELNVEEFINQASLYRSLIDESLWNKILQSFAVAPDTHPFLTIRVTELIAWWRSNRLPELNQ